MSYRGPQRDFQGHRTAVGFLGIMNIRENSGGLSEEMATGRAQSTAVQSFIVFYKPRGVSIRLMSYDRLYEGLSKALPERDTGGSSLCFCKPKSAGIPKAEA